MSTKIKPWKPLTEKEIVKEIALDIGKAVVAHIRTMYPTAYEVAPSTFGLSVQGCVANEIMEAIKVEGEEAIFKRLAERRKFRRWMIKAYKGIRKK